MPPCELARPAAAPLPALVATAGERAGVRFLEFLRSATRDRTGPLPRKWTTMLEYQDRTVEEVAVCTCDRCQKRMTSGDPDWHEKVSVAFRGGFDSIFGDGSEVSIDLCQQCVREALGEWLRITPPGNDGMTYQERLRSEWDGREADRLRSPPGSAGEDDA